MGVSKRRKIIYEENKNGKQKEKRRINGLHPKQER